MFDSIWDSQKHERESLEKNHEEFEHYHDLFKHREEYDLIDYMEATTKTKEYKRLKDDCK